MSSSDNMSIPKPFIIYWIGQVVSLLGSEITQFAIIWWILVTYESTFLFGLGLFAGAASRVIVLPLIGVISDWWNRKKILIVADLLQSLVTVIMIFAFYYDVLTFRFLFLLLTLRGFFQSLHQNANSAIIPQLVSRDKYSKLNAMDWFSLGLSNFGGPIIGAVLVELFGKENLEFILLIDVITFGIALIAVWWIKIPDTSKATLSPSFVKNITFGFNYIKQQRILTLLVSLTVIFNLTLTTTHVIMPLFVLSRNEFNAGSRQLGLAIGCQSLGIILASIFISIRPVRNHYGGRMVLSVFTDAIAISLIGLSLLTHNLLVLYLAQFLTGIAISYYSVIGATIWQQLVPNDILGRVNATKRIFAVGSYPVGLILTGFLAEKIHPVLLVFGGIGICILYLIWLWWISSFHNLEAEIKSINISD